MNIQKVVLNNIRIIRVETVYIYVKLYEFVCLFRKGCHRCCNICKASCKCGDCANNLYEQAKEHSLLQHGQDICMMFRSVEAENLGQLKVALFDLKNKLDQEIYTSNSIYGVPELVHGLDISTIKELTQNAERIFSVDDVIDKCGIGIYSTACDIVSVFSDIFGDMDNDLEINEDTLL